jgi:hypothetical protein
MSIKSKVKAAARRVWTWVVAAALGVAAFFGFEAQSQAVVTDTLTWTAPTQFVDGSAIPAGTITGYRFAWATSAGGTFSTEADVGNVLTVQTTRPQPGYGTRCYRVAALVGMTNGEWSEVKCKTVQAPARAPGGFTVQ